MRDTELSENSHLEAIEVHMIIVALQRHITS